jgi:hypothetical protein
VVVRPNRPRSSAPGPVDPAQVRCRASRAQRASCRWYAGFGPSILINGVAPYFIYFVLHHQFQVAELPALLATSIPPLLDALVGIVRWRQIDFLAGFVLFTISLAVALVALGGDPRLYLIRESFITAAIGLAFIISNPLPRPLGFFFARYFMAGDDRARVTWVNDRWQGSAGFRHAIRFSNVIWGRPIRASRASMLVSAPVGRRDTTRRCHMRRIARA